MGSYHEEVEVPLSTEDAMSMCRSVATQLGWAIEGDGPGYLWVTSGLAFAAVRAPGRLNVSVHPAGASASRVTIERRKTKGDWYYVGADKVVTPAGQTYRSALIAAVAQPRVNADASAPTGIAQELAKLAELHQSGAITDAEYTAAKVRALGK